MITQSQQKGFTVVEMMVALTLGIILLTGALIFFSQSSKTMQIGQENSVITGKGQMALSKMTREIKGINTDAPPLFNVSPNWTDLPALPYQALELSTYPTTGGSVLMPAMPAIRLYPAQATPSDIYHKWYPNPDDPELSNSMVFYKAPAPGPGGTSLIERITYRYDAARKSLVREVQRSLSSASTNFHSSPTPQITVLSDRVHAVQFSYPTFAQAMTTTLDSELDTLLSNEGNAALQQFINENFRAVVGIRLVMAGPEYGNKSHGGVELTTEVRLRNQ